MLSLIRSVTSSLPSRAALARFNAFSFSTTAVTPAETRQDTTLKVARRKGLKKVAVVLSGSGVYDGTEITEAVATLINLSLKKIQYECFAPNKDQLHVINHITGQPVEGQSRNVLVESARIARGKVRDIKELKATDFDGVIFPGGFGAAKNLSDWAVNGKSFTVDPEVERVIREFHATKRGIGAFCSSPLLVAKILGKNSGGPGAKLTLGKTGNPAFPYSTAIADAVSLGNENKEKTAKQVVFDGKNILATTPCYMQDTATPADVFEGVGKAIDTLIDALAPKKRVKKEEIDE
eukprot:TRINITY_DN547_c0_g1_i5.p1 TRINITY_DN547_c0_g1~~TRINITY_DN547_c0_g1_i5.p1  ORF type:complete len:293 (-),score=121.55 TRINITY_DN547_c0_g1_i5:332-1210(-)